MERLFLVTRRDEKGKQYISKVIKSEWYPSGEDGDITEIPNGGTCYIYLTSREGK